MVQECKECGGEVDPDEAFTCLDCGESHLEDYAAAAYDYYKGIRQDGE